MSLAFGNCPGRAGTRAFRYIFLQKDAAAIANSAMLESKIPRSCSYPLLYDCIFSPAISSLLI